MEVKISYRTMARCHRSDLWEVFRNIEDWRRYSGVVGDAGWVHGEPWKQGSRFFCELRFPVRLDMEVLVQKCVPGEELLLLSHGGGIATEQWITFRNVDDHSTLIETDQAIVSPLLNSSDDVRGTLLAMFERWFDGLKNEAEKHCAEVAL